MRGIIVWFGLLTPALLLGREPLTQRVDALVNESPVMPRAHWGAIFVHEKSGRVMFARNENSTFTPASNTKLYSTALALSRLGPAYRFRTRLVATAALSDQGTLEGDLVLVGGGDPTMSGRPLPYDSKAAFGDPLAAIDEMVEKAMKAGLRSVRGAVIGDDTRYVWEPFPDGWAQDDTIFDYGAPVSALVLHDNSFKVVVEPGARVGDDASLAATPGNAYFEFAPRVRTAGKPPAKVLVDRSPGSRRFDLWGAVALRHAVRLDLAVDDPALYAAYALRDSLVRHGVAVQGEIRARHWRAFEANQPPAVDGVELALRDSPPLSETLQVIDKVSHNLQAEIVLRETARVRGREATRRGGIEELEDFLSSIGVTADQYRFEDGSGLSRLTLVTPAMTLRLLRSMFASPHRDLWTGLMPIGGEDGTLSHRFRKIPDGTAVFAKTGTISNVGALSGYARDVRGETITFSVMVNNANGNATVIRDFIDKLVLLMLE